jgi:hypothetical protein
MHLTRRLAVTAAMLLLCAGVAVAATSSPSGTYSGNVHWTDPGAGKEKFLVTVTLKKGKATQLKGKGDPGFVPFNPKKSNATVGCGAANTFDSGNGKISGQVGSTRSFLFTWKNEKFHIVVTLDGQFVSATKAKAHFRYYQSHLPGKGGSTGHCDSGELPVTLKKS